MHVYRAGLAAVIVIPDLRENLIARKHHTAVFQQIAQQFKFFVREDHGFTINRNSAALHIHRKRAAVKSLSSAAGFAALRSSARTRETSSIMPNGFGM